MADDIFLKALAGLTGGIKEGLEQRRQNELKERELGIREMSAQARLARDQKRGAMNELGAEYTQARIDKLRSDVEGKTTSQVQSASKEVGDIEKRSSLLAEDIAYAEEGLKTAKGKLRESLLTELAQKKTEMDTLQERGRVARERISSKTGKKFGGDKYEPYMNYMRSAKSVDDIRAFNKTINPRTLPPDVRQRLLDEAVKRIGELEMGAAGEPTLLEDVLPQTEE